MIPKIWQSINIFCLALKKDSEYIRFDSFPTCGRMVTVLHLTDLYDSDERIDNFL